MSNLSDARRLELVLSEINARNKASFSLKDYCFDKQLAFISDPHPFKTAVCSRRAGKTVGCAAHLSWAALNRPGIVCLYITLSRSNAKKLIWPELKSINERFKLGGTPNESDLSITFRNKSVIYCSGAKHEGEIEKFRGLPLYLCYIDECQSFRPYIRNLVESVISKALFDYAGTLVLTGTPGPVPAGYFYDCATSSHWSHHAWTLFDNPWIEKKSGLTPQQLVERDMQRMGVTIEDPVIQRECFGRWVVDLNALVFRYEEARNHYDQLPASASKWHSVIGVDLGYDDSDAIAVISWNDKHPGSYLTFEKQKAKQGITELCEQLAPLIQEHDPNAIVMDTGGLGKKIAEEIRRRFGIPVKAAEKQRKFEHIEILNDALRTGKFMAKRDSIFAFDSKLVEWDRDPERGPEATPKIKESFHSDMCDAVLYAFRESLHWLHEPAPPTIVRNTPEWFKEQERLLEEQALEALHGKQDDPWSF
jgi:hypothetical protein